MSNSGNGEGTGRNAYKDTLNLPKTSFDMRANLLAKEPALQERWNKDNLYKRIRRARDGARRFILHDGPPYANGNIHMGTALNKVLKDIVIRIKTMSGMDAPYLPGWDCHGLPIEQKVLEELGATAAGLEPMEIRRHCRMYAQKFADMQSQQFRRLGVMGEFQDPYITMNSNYEGGVLEVFARLIEQGIVYRQLKPVHWSIENRTALADAELEYHDRSDPSIYLALELAGDPPGCPASDGTKTHLLVWTTTPWTLPANLAVAVHPDYEYCYVELDTVTGLLRVVVAAERVEAVLSAIRGQREGWLRSYRLTGRVRGTELIEANLRYVHPLIEDKLCPVVGASYVTLEDGTGLVHTAPGHGLEDYGTALKCRLEIYCPVLADGMYDKTVPSWLAGVSVWDANSKIIEYLKGKNRLAAWSTVTHSYPHDWRSKTPTIFRATEQFFVAVDQPLQGRASSLRQLAMDVCRLSADDGGIDFIPAWGRNRIAGMLESRPDWCISRQRAWGLPIPAFYNPDGKLLLTPASVRAVARTIGREGSDCWFTLSPKQLLDGYNPADDKDLNDPESFDVDKLTCGADIFDVWFESGSSWFTVAIGRGLVPQLPVDLYLEGSDQHRGWFQLSLLPALGAAGRPPFRSVLTHGYVVDDQGYKMSKSVGNTIDVIEQLQKRGADVLRLWVASQNYQDDIRCSEKLIAQAEDAYRKIRNTLRFAMGACFDFDPRRHSTDPPDHSIDLWMRLELNRLIRDVRQAYERYEFHRASRLLYEFCTVQASSIYMSAVKDRLYCESPNAIRRRSSQTVIHQLLISLVKLLAPIMPHTCQEAWEHIPFRPPDEPDDVHMAALPEYNRDFLQMAEEIRPVTPDLASFSTDELHPGPAWIWERLLELRDLSLLKLEALRNAGVKNPLDAEAVFEVPQDNKPLAELIKTYLKEMEDLIGVGYARLELVPALKDKALDVQVIDTRQKYPRCARCWKRRPDVGSNPKYPDLSSRDAFVMEELKGA